MEAEEEDAVAPPSVERWWWVLIVSECVALALWCAVFVEGIREKESLTEDASFDQRLRADTLTLDAIAAAPHFLVLVSVLELRRELRSKCRKSVCRHVEASWGWVVPPAICVVFDALAAKRAAVFYADVQLVRATVAVTAASSAAAAVWCALVYRELTGLRARSVVAPAFGTKKISLL